ncbi:hypothetical protein D9758_013888 [Tetrapyrgos nigripes]|uniref:HAT C-terminal dimerisation domain-containing protein n=1 Tax=Tetrapyrgos nigripes TaxID=182062 RepID=A0A8H5CMP3_9AGAR|nr:hypothetical protein D9758_013888 [Tetrapyrgos nigripes]
MKASKHSSHRPSLQPSTPYTVAFNATQWFLLLFLLTVAPVAGLFFTLSQFPGFPAISQILSLTSEQAADLPCAFTGLFLYVFILLHSTDYPVWASLARDYCAIMASSVSSERTFSSAGITISKRRNRLGKDIVEPLQFLKCALRRNLIFREAPLEDDNVEADDGTLEDETEDWVELIDVDEAEDSGEDLDYDGFN